MTSSKPSRRKAKAFLLDFDGPIARLFTHHPAPLAALELRTLLTQGGYGHDPYSSMGFLDILRHAERSSLPQEFVEHLNFTLSSYELKAALSAPASLGAHEAIWKLKELNLPAAIVTNNSKAAIEAYLKLHSLPELPIVARPSSNFSSMKPSPAPLTKALKIMGANPLETIMLGDEPSDMVAANAAGVRAIGYAKSQEHALRLWENKAEEVIYHFDELHEYF